MVACDRISTYDAVHPTPIPDKGKVLTGLSVFWFEQTAEIVANHLISATEGVPEEARGRALVVRKLEMLPVECVVRGYITGSGWKDYQGPARSAGSSCPPACWSPSSCPSRSSPRGQRRGGPRRGHRLRGRRDPRRRPRAHGARARRLARRVHARRRARAQRGMILADTKFELGLDPDPARWRSATRCSRRLLALLAGRRLQGRPRPAELRQAVRARLGRGQRLGQAPARTGDPRGRGSGHPGALRRGIRADRRRASQAWLGSQAAPGDEAGPRADPPQGGHATRREIAVERALPALGFAGVANVHVGRLVELDVEDEAQLQPMCEKLLANPLVEEYEVQLLGRPGQLIWEHRAGRRPYAQVRYSCTC